jgi:cytochrome c peroxidase
MVVAAAGCGYAELTTTSANLEVVPLGLDPVVPTPSDNPPTDAKLELGERLFFDSILSIDRTRSCASCHRPDRAFSDDRALSLGIRDQPTRRNAPALVNRAWGRSSFRDGRAPTLESAVLQPVVNPAELGMTLPELEDRLGTDSTYTRLFDEAFESGDRPTATQAAAALSTFIRSLRSGTSPADRYAAGDSAALTQTQEEGRALFFGKAHCTSCHAGPTFTDEGFHNTGVAVRSGDPGRLAVTGDPRHAGAFRTPTLRDIALTAPYMHDGSMASLEEVVDFYDQGGLLSPGLDPLDPLVRPLHLSATEKEALVAFLEALMGSR